MNHTKPLTLIFSREIHYFVDFLFVLLSLVAIVANSLVLVTVIRKRSLHTAFNIPLSNLCLANVLAAIAIYPYVFVINVRQFNVFERKERILCAFTDGNSIFFICSGTALFSLCAISFNRYLTLKHPCRSKVRMRKREFHIFNVLAWTFMVIILAPSILCFKHSSIVGACVRDWTPINDNGIIYRVVIVVLTFFLPITFLLLSYIALRRQIRKRPQSQGRNNPVRRKSFLRSKKAEQVVLLLILNFLICWLPFLCYWILMAASDILKGNEAAIRRLQVVRIATLFTLLNCSMDPFLYMVGSSELRHEVHVQLDWMLNRSKRNKNSKLTAVVKFRPHNGIKLEQEP